MTLRTAARPVVVGIGIALAASVLATVPASVAQSRAAAAPEPATAGLDYVALGDSYAAGFGITPITNAPVPGCEQAAANYPHQVAAALGMNLTDVTCTAAVTANIIGTEQVTASYFSGGGTALPQSTALSADTDVATVSIGGNDAGFSRIAAECLAETAAGPVAGPDLSFSAPNCQSLYVVNGVDTLAQLITTTVAQNLANAYTAIAQAAPNAEVFVVGYPSLLPDAANTPAGGCFTPAFSLTTPPPGPPNAVPFTDVDVPYIYSVEVLLNQTIAQQAAAAGFTFIDNQPGSVAHSACPQDADPYINGISIISFVQEPFTANGGLHPNVAGVAFLTAQVTAAISAAFPSAGPAVVPSPVAPEPALAASGPGGSITPALVVAGGLLVLGMILVAVGRRTFRQRSRPASRTALHG